MKKANKEIRQAIDKAGLFYYQVANELGIKSDATFTKWLRFELSEDKREMIYGAIEKLSKKKGV